MENILTGLRDKNNCLSGPAHPLELGTAPRNLAVTSFLMVTEILSIFDG